MDPVPLNTSGGGSRRAAEHGWGPGTLGVLLLACAVLLVLLVAGHGCTDETKPEANPPVLLLEPDSLGFGAVRIGSHAELSFTLGNRGGGTLAGTIAESCPDYAIISGGGSYSLGANESREIRVRFAPTIEGPSECVIPIGEDARVTCTAEALAPLPSCSFSPDSLDFGPTVVGTVTDRIFTIVNTGGGTLSGSVGTGCAAFSVLSGDGPFELEADQSHQIEVRFAPTGFGPVECSLEIGSGECSDYRCLGEGVPEPPVCSIEPDTLEFGSVDIGSASERTFTITNTGGSNLAGSPETACDDYEIISGGGTFELAPEESVEMTIRFSPAAEGTRTCVIDLGQDLCGGVFCSGIGFLPPRCSLTPQSLDFGQLAVGSSRDLSFTIENIGGGSLTGDVTEDCDGYEIVTGSGPYALYGGQKRTVTVRFTPSGDGLHDCTIETGNESCGPVACSGTGTGGTCFVGPTTLDFGQVEIGSSLDRRFTIDNIGTSVLTGAVAETCQAFSIVSGGGSYTLNPGDPPRVVTVRFSPSTEGALDCAVLTGGWCEPVMCTGEGSVSSVCSVSPVQLDFGSVHVGRTSDLPFLITNTGTEPFSGTVRETCLEFVIVSGGGAYTLNPGMDRRVVVRFTPISGGLKTCTVETGSPHCSDVGCSGEGSEGDPICSITPTTLNFGDVDTGTQSERSFTIKNVGGETLTGSVSESCEEYSIVSGAGDYSLAAGRIREVTVRFSPQSEGTKECSIETGNDLCPIVACNGAGVEPTAICSVDPISLDFGPADVGTESDLSFSITNIGGGTLTGSVGESCEDFLIVSGAGEYSLENGETRTVVVRFAPGSPGDKDCAINTGSDICEDVSCSGEAVWNPPVCSLSADSLDFGGVLLGASADRSFTITNTGGSVLTGSATESCETYTIVAGGGDYSLGSNEQHEVTVRFAPVEEGIVPCIIEIGNELCANIICSGEGIGAACGITPTSLEFDDILVGESEDLSFVIRNAGGGALIGSVDADCGQFYILNGQGPYNLAASDSLEVTIRFAPGSGGADTCIVETGSDLCSDVLCTGTGIGSSCEVSPTYLYFGYVEVDSTWELSFSITNAGGGQLSGEIAIEEACPYYTIISGGGSYDLGAGETHWATVRFSPGEMGIHNCTIDIGNDLCADVHCNGRGVGPICEVEPPALDFGPILIGESADTSFTISNIGLGGVLTGTVGEACDHYSILDGEGSYALAAGEELTVTIRFEPLADGPLECTVDTGTDLCPDVTTTGEGIGPLCRISPTSLDFEQVEVGAAAELSFTITNDGGGWLTGSPGESCPHYEIVSGGGGYNLGAGQSQEVVVRYAPEEMGVHNCTIETGDALCTDVACTGEGVGPLCSVEPAALDFGKVLVGASLDTTFTITNTGTGGTLTGSVTEACGHFSILSGGGAYALGAGEVQTVTVRFEPLAEGPLACTIETGSDLCSDVSCVGEGLGPICQIEPASLDFGQVVVDSTAELSFTITNGGGGWLSGDPNESCPYYEIVSGGGGYNLGAGESQEVVVRYAPEEMGVHNCTIETGDAHCADVGCTGEGVGPICSVEPIVLDFGSVNIGDFVDSTFTISNIGTGGFLTGMASEACGHYSIIPEDEPYSLEVGEEITVTVRFAPLAAGTQECTVDTGNEICSDVACTGVGIGPSCEIVPPSLDFGQVEVDSTADLSFTIANTGGGTLHGTVSESCPHYSIELGEGPFSLESGESVMVTVRYAPEDLGVHNCTILTGSGLCGDVGCTGEGVGPVCSIEPVAINFGQVNIGAFADSTFTITNDGTGGILSGTVSETCRGYSIIAGGGSYELAVGEERVVTVRFEPDSATVLDCMIETGNDGCSDVSCTGEGLGPECDVSPTGLDFGQVDVGSTAGLDFRIKNTGGGFLAGTVGDTCTHYSVIAGGGPYNLGAGDSVVVTVEFAPMEAGVHVCTIETGDDQCLDVGCTGEGCPVCPASPLTVSAGSDVVILSEHPDSNSCGRTTNLVGHTEAGTHDLETLLYFDVSAIPPEATITAVDLEVYPDSCTYSPPDDTILVGLSRLDAAFDECSVTWNTAPAATPIIGCTDSLFCAPAGYQTLDCTGLTGTVQGWIENPAANYGIEIVPAASESGAIVLRSYHHPETTPPRLVIYFTCPCP